MYALWTVVICFHFSIFEPLETTYTVEGFTAGSVVICFHFSIFEPLETTLCYYYLLSLRCDLLSF